MRKMFNIFQKRIDKDHLPPGRKSRSFKFFAAAALLAMFFAAMPPAPAAAQTTVNANIIGDPATLPILGTISSAIAGVLSFLQAIQVFILQHGFASNAAATISTGSVISKTITDAATFQAQSNLTAPWTAQIAALQRDATPPDQSTACPAISDAQNYNVQQDAINKAQRNLQALAAGEGKTGVTPVAKITQVVGQLCKLGMLPSQSDGSYGTYLSSMNCTQDQNFTNAAVSSWYNASNGSGPLGMLVPSGVTRDAKTGNLDFSNIPAGNGDCRTDGRCFAAAMLHCELLKLADMDDSPPYGSSGQPTQQIMAAIAKDIVNSSNKDSAYEQCIKNIGYRAICNSSSSSAAIAAVGGSGGGGGATCAQLQQQACKTLGTQPIAGASTGTGGDGGGMGIMTPDVQSCMGGGSGLSLAEQDRDTMFAPCLDTNYATNVSPSLKSWDESSKDTTNCREKLSEFYNRIGSSAGGYGVGGAIYHATEKASGE